MWRMENTATCTATAQNWKSGKWVTEPRIHVKLENQSRSDSLPQRPRRQYEFKLQTDSTRFTVEPSVIACQCATKLTGLFPGVTSIRPPDDIMWTTVCQSIEAATCPLRSYRRQAAPSTIRKQLGCFSLGKPRSGGSGILPGHTDRNIDQNGLKAPGVEKQRRGLLHKPCRGTELSSLSHNER